MGSTVSTIAKFALPIAGAVLAPEIGIPALAGSALGGAAGGLVGGGGLSGALRGGITGAAGNAIGGAIGPTIGSALGGSAANATLSGVSGGLADSLGGAIGNTTVGSALSGFAGNEIAGSMFPQRQPQQQQAANPNSLQPTPFSPSNIPNLQMPGSLSDLMGQDTGQQTSNLATQGVYGGGLGPKEQAYFTGLVNNQLVDPSGKVGNMSSLSPIENSYLSQLGFGGYSNSNDLLGAISKWQKQQPGQATA